VQTVSADPALVGRGLVSIERWLGSRFPTVRPVLLEGRELLEGPRERWGETLLSTDERATRLRQSSPFAGVLTEAERNAILKRFHPREPLTA
jgi:hypothetical protein